jgi:hypothetical protein
MLDTLTFEIIMNTETIKAGIAGYAAERELIEQFLVEPKSEHEFDEHFSKYPTGRFRKEGVSGSDFILGNFMTGYGHISWWMHLLSFMVAAGDVIQTKKDNTLYYQIGTFAPR